MPITLDATSNIQAGVDLAAGTISHITGTLANRLMVVAPASRDTASATDVVVTGVTYNSVALTKINSNIQSATTVHESSELWYLVNPSAGTFNVIISYTGAVNFLTAGVATLGGVDQTTPIHGSAGTNGLGGTLNPETQSVSIPTTNDQTWVIASTYNTTSGSASKPLVIGAGQTAIFTGAPNGSSDSSSASYKPDLAIGTTTMSYTWNGDANGNQGWAMSVAAINPDVPAGSVVVSAYRSLLGVGN